MQQSNSKNSCWPLQNHQSMFALVTVSLSQLSVDSQNVYYQLLVDFDKVYTKFQKTSTAEDSVDRDARFQSVCLLLVNATAIHKGFLFLTVYNQEGAIHLNCIFTHSFNHLNFFFFISLYMYFFEYVNQLLLTMPMCLPPFLTCSSPLIHSPQI